MSSIQIPNLPATIALGGSEQFEIVQAGVSQYATLNLIASFILNGGAPIYYGSSAMAPTLNTPTTAYVIGSYYQYTNPVAGGFEGQKVVSSGGNLVWKTVRPITS